MQNKNNKKIRNKSSGQIRKQENKGPWANNKYETIKNIRVPGQIIKYEHETNNKIRVHGQIRK